MRRNFLAITFTNRGIVLLLRTVLVPKALKSNPPCSIKVIVPIESQQANGVKLMITIIEK